MVNRKWLMVWNDSVVLCWLVGWNPKTNPVENIIEHYLNLAHLARQPGAFSIVLGIACRLPSTQGRTILYVQFGNRLI